MARNDKGFFGFRAQSVPQFGTGPEGEKLRAEALLEEHSFLEAMQFDKLIRRRLSAEIRYVAHQTTKEVQLWLLFDAREFDEFEVEILARDIGRLLPRGYGFETVLGLTASTLPVPQRSGSGEWFTSRAVRRLVIADLPTAREVLEKPEPISSATAGRSVIDEETQRSIVGFNDWPLRPDDGDRYAIPLIMAIRSDGVLGPAFFRQLQASAPAMVSIRFARLDPTHLPLLRGVANKYLQGMDNLSRIIEKAYGDESASYRRYLLPDDLFNLLDIGFATSGMATTRSVCHTFISHIGGLAAFQEGDRAREDDLSEFPYDIRASDLLNDEHFRDFRAGYLDEDLRAFNTVLKEIEDPVRQFMLDAPYVFTFHEVVSVFRLPVADERGLPGIDSRPLPPFNSPSLSYDPVLNAAGSPVGANLIGGSRAQSIRIGMRGKIRLGQNGKMHATLGESGGDPHWHRLRPRELTKHALIVGTTGSGKTMVTGFIIQELVRLGVPFCIVEPVKTEYFQKIADKLPDSAPLRRFNFEGTRDGKRGADFFTFDPLRLPAGVTVIKHVSYLKSAWQAAFPMDILGSMLLENGLLKYYTDPIACDFGQFTIGNRGAYKIRPFGPKLGTSSPKDASDSRKSESRTLGIFPSFETFKSYFLSDYLTEIFKASGRNEKGNEIRENAIQFFNRRFALLEGSLLGESMREAKRRAVTKIAAHDPAPLADGLDDLFTGSTILELDSIPDNDDKALVMAFVLTRLYEIRQAASLLARDLEEAERLGCTTGQKPIDELRHVLIIEEAHRLLDAYSVSANRGQFGGIDPKAKAISMFVDMLAEIRAFGQGIVIVEQIPTKIVPEAIKNTNLKIMLRMPSPQDREALGQAMNLTEEQIRYVATLRANPESGIDFVAFEEQLDQPILLNLPLPDVSIDGMRSRRRARWLFDEFFDQRPSKPEMSTP